MEGKEMRKLGSSLLVPSVQELANQPLTKIPQIYVRPRDGEHSSNNNANLSSQVPIIDWFHFSSDLKASELQKLHSACQHWGFFQVINHGVDEKVVEGVKKGVKEFFDLPMEEKKKYWQTEDDLEGFGQAFVKSKKQKLDWADMFYFITLPPSLRKPHLFPKLPLPFKDDLEAYCGEMRKMALRILKTMEEALGMKENEMIESFEKGWQSMRMNYYPPCPEPDLVNGISPHSDSTSLTILLQLNEAEQAGLQIKHNGSWIPVTFLPNAFVVNVGDMLEVVTNGIYKSIDHRATVGSTKERMSIATFYGPELEGELGPAPSLVTAERPTLFRTTGVAEFFESFLSRELDGKTHLDTIRIDPK